MAIVASAGRTNFRISCDHHAKVRLLSVGRHPYSHAKRVQVPIQQRIPDRSSGLGARVWVDCVTHSEMRQPLPHPAITAGFAGDGAASTGTRRAVGIAQTEQCGSAEPRRPGDDRIPEQRSPDAPRAGDANGDI